MYIFYFIFNKRGFFTPHERTFGCFFTTKQAQTKKYINTNVEKIFYNSGQYPMYPLEGDINQSVTTYTLANKNFIKVWQINPIF